MGITIDSARGKAEKTLREPRVWISVFAQAEHFFFAEETFAARNRERDNYPITHFSIFHVGTGFNNFPHEFMAHDVAFFHGWNVTVIEMQVGAADSGRRNLYDGVATIEDLRVRHALDPYILFAVPTVS